MAKVEEVLGLVNGLASVVKDQQAASQDVNSQTQASIQALSDAVQKLSTAVSFKESTTASPLRLPQLTLPEFTGREDLDRFAEQLTHVLSSSGVSPKYWFPYLKQQCQKDARAFDIICSFETDSTFKLPEKATNDEHLSFYDKCLCYLKKQRGIPKEQQIRQLLATYYSMMQQANESISDFAHRFRETQHSLEKLIPGIHLSTDPKNRETELVHAFTMKLKPTIAKQLLSRDTAFPDLTSVIAAAKRYESVDSVLPTPEADQSWKPAVLYAEKGETKPKQQFTPKKHFTPRQDNATGTKLCWFYNKFHTARCELPNNKCSKGFIHKCSQCFRQNCKLRFHLQQGSRASNSNSNREQNSSKPSDRNVSANIVSTSDNATLVDTVKQAFEASIQELRRDLTASIATEVEKRLPQTPSSQANLVTSQDHIYGMPAVTALPSNSQLSDLDLADKNILWTKVTSAGVTLPLPLDSCCSVSLVSQKHADTVARQHPNLRFTKLERQLPVSVAGPNSNLRAVGTMQVPIIWENGQSVIFTMLVVPNLTWPILFGQNHLRKTDARIHSKDLRVFFADSAMNFEISCYDSNPLDVFSVSKSQNPSMSSTANVTCLLTAMPPACGPGEHVTLRRGLNLVTVCFVITASLIGSPLLSGTLWLEGNQFSPGLQTLSGPIDFRALKSDPCSGGKFPPFHPTSHPGFSKCRPSRPIPEVRQQCQGILASRNNDSIVEFDANNEVFYTNVYIRSTKDSVLLPSNVSLGIVRSANGNDNQEFNEAADYTAKQLSDYWYEYVTAINVPQGIVQQGNANSAGVFDHKPALVSLPTDANTSGLDSSCLSRFAEQPDCETECLFPPTNSANLQPHSEAFHAELLKALDLDAPYYAHVPKAVLCKFTGLLKQYPNAFYLPNSPLSTIKGFYHNIQTGDSPPVYKLPYRKSPAELAAIKEELERMVKLQIVQPSHSPWGAPCILVRKPLEKGKPQPPRFVVDYRGLNAVTQGDGYPIPNVSNILDAISGGKLFAKLDLASGYWQVPMNPRDREKTAFATHLGLWEFLRMPFGLKTAGQTFQRILNTVFADFLYKWLIIYIDDCVTWSSSYEQALTQYELLLKRAVEFGIQFKPSKCAFFSTNLQILGHRITPEGRLPTEKGTEAISAFQRPHNVPSLKRFLGMVGYFREYIQNMSHRTKHLRSLLSQKASFSWSAPHEAEFQDLKTALLSPKIILFHPDWDKEFEVHTDASKIGSGAMLAQYHNGILRPVRFASRSFNSTESRWPTAHQEFFAVKWALEQFRHYLIGRKFKVITDHANLKFLAAIAPQNSKLARWCLSLAEFDFVIEHRPGKENIVPDALSRAPLPHPSPAVCNYVIPPSEVCCFLLTALSLDITAHNTQSVAELFNFPLSCLSLACSVDPLKSTAKPLPKHKQLDAAPCTVQNATNHASDLGLHENLPVSAQLPDDLQQLRPLNFDRAQFAQKQRKDPWLGPLVKFLISGNAPEAISDLHPKLKRWVFAVAKRTKLIDGVLFYSDEFMSDPDHMRIFVPNDTDFQRHLLHAYHDSPLGMHRGRDATYNAISRDFYWRNLSKHVRNWIRRCPHCIRFKTLNQQHGPMQVRVYQHPFHTLGVDYVGELPSAPSGNKWILTAVCPFSNFLRAIPVPDKTATTAARVLLHEVFMPFGFPAILQSDRGGEWLNAILQRLSSLLSIKQVFTSGYRPRLNGSTERVHRFLNSAIGIYCERNQEMWDEYLQPAVYAHNTSPISGISDVTPFFLVFGRKALSPETIAMQMPASSLPADHYAHNLVAKMKEAHTHFQQIKSDLRRHQRELYDLSSRDLHIPEGKLVYMRKDNISSQAGKASRFIRNFDGPYIVTGHPFDRSDLLTLRNAVTNEDLPRPVNIEKVVVVPEPETTDLRLPSDAIVEPETDLAPQTINRHPNPDLVTVAFEFGKYLESQPSKSAVSSQACKFVYERNPSAREILARHGKLRGLIKSCPYLHLEGGSQGGTYILTLNQEVFSQISR